MRDDNTEPRDNQQTADDNQQAGTSVTNRQSSGDARQPTTLGRDDDAAIQTPDAEPARGSRESVHDREGEQGPLD